MRYKTMNPKDFDGWDALRRKLQDRLVDFYCKRREIWWCSLGVNIGSEQDGGGVSFERPVLILQVFNKETVRIVPITNTMKKSKYYFPITCLNSKHFVITSHIQTLNTKRLSKLITRIDESQFKQIKEWCRATL